MLISQPGSKMDWAGDGIAGDGGSKRVSAACSAIHGGTAQIASAAYQNQRSEVHFRYLPPRREVLQVVPTEHQAYCIVSTRYVRRAKRSVVTGL